MAKDKKKKSSRVDNLIMVFFVVIIILVVFITYFGTSYINGFIGSLQENIERRLISDCRVLESMVTIEQLENYQTPEDMDREDYKELLVRLQKYADEQELEFAYFMRLKGNEVQYIIDSDPNPEERLGLDYYEEPYWLVYEAYNQRRAVVNFIGDYEDGWEGLISAYVPIFDDDDNIIAIVGVDITDEEIVERREATETFTYIAVVSSSILGIAGIAFIIRYRKKAQAANDASIAKSEFLSRMSHEIRTPMNAIIGFCRMAKSTNDSVKKGEYIDSISSSSDYLLELINDILDISKIEASKMSLNVKKASLLNIIRNIEVILASQIAKKNQSFKIELPDEIPKYVYCDETRLSQIIVNLTGNSIKFTPEGGRILVKVSLLERVNNSCNLQFIVQDNGIGIEEEAAAKLFQPFEQADGSITRKYGGTGLGLAISKRFVEMMKGTISVTSKVGEGSTFKFNIWLDIVPDSEISADETKETTNQDLEPVDCNGMIFLVAEDNQINQVIVKDLFENFGATIELANNGIECVEKFEQNPEKYEIIFMDIQMPEMDGLEATRKIRASEVATAKTIPIVAMTAEVFQEDINNALNAGMNEHLGKPINISEVEEVIRKYIKKSEESE